MCVYVYFKFVLVVKYVQMFVLFSLCKTISRKTEIKCCIFRTRKAECACTDMHVSSNFILDRLFFLRAVARHREQIVDIAKDLPLKDTCSRY